MIGLTALMVVSAALSLWLLWDRTILQMRIAFALDQTAIFDEMRAKAIATEPAETVGLLEYVVKYYPSGTKQEMGSRMDQIVERHRASTIREIIAHLRLKTGQELGDDPQKWIDKFRGG